MQQYAKACAHKRWHQTLVAVGSSLAKMTDEFRSQALNHILRGIKEDLKETDHSKSSNLTSLGSHPTAHPEEIVAFNVHDFALQPERCSHGRTAFEGWGLVDADDNSTGLPVTVLEVSAKRLEEIQVCVWWGIYESCIDRLWRCYRHMDARMPSTLRVRVSDMKCCRYCIHCSSLELLFLYFARLFRSSFGCTATQ